jgi:hypothetical protein
MMSKYLCNNYRVLNNGQFVLDKTRRRNTTMFKQQEVIQTLYELMILKDHRIRLLEDESHLLKSQPAYQYQTKL